MNLAFVFILSYLVSFVSPPDQVLVFSKTAGYRHASIEIGVETIKALGIENNFEVTHTENAEVFNAERLKNYKLVVFINTSGVVLDTAQKQAFKAYINTGGNFLGVHGASATEANWLWYGELVGAQFLDHPKPCEATLLKTDIDHPATAHLNSQWSCFDEWYNFKIIYPDIVPVLLLDETSYSGGKHSDYHPIAWYQEFNGSRSFYTGLGHTKAAYENPDFKKHLLGGILYCLER